MAKVSVIIPVYNEEGNVKTIYDRVKNVLQCSDYDYEVLFVDDGSTDDTRNHVMELMHDGNKGIKLISFTRNFGHQLALVAGYNHCSGDAAITIDGDLQHPPELISDMLKKWEDGYDIVNTKRIDKYRPGIFKKTTSKFYYKIFSWASGVPIDEGSADFRLIDKKVLDRINGLQEYELFLRGMFRWLGYRSVSIDYIPNERFSGKTKYSLRKMVHFAVNGITSFSIMPLKVVTFMGFLVSGLAVIYMVYTILSAIFFKDVVTGWASIMISVLFIGGVQLISIGILGEYIGKIFVETKKRPRYVIDFIKG